MTNAKLRTALKDKGIYLWKVAKLMGISEATMTRMMREELSEEKQDEIIALVEKEVQKS